MSYIYTPEDAECTSSSTYNILEMCINFQHDIHLKRVPHIIYWLLLIFAKQLIMACFLKLIDVYHLKFPYP